MPNITGPNHMRLRGNRVTVSADEVSNFMRRFPCSGLHGTRLWFEFESNGDLVDMGPGDTSTQDGAGLVALSKYAQEYFTQYKKTT